MSSAEVVRAWEARGRRFGVGGVRSFVVDEGAGEPVVCLHGVPVSAFLYRKVVDELAGRGLRGIAFDLPGLGLAQRPRDFDYSWTGLGRFAAAAVDALELDRFHLVVHDIGGPVGFELAAALPDRVASLTILNTLVAVSEFRKPWVMRPFEKAPLGELYLATLSKPAFRVLMRLQGVADMSTVRGEELDAHVDLLKRGDGGAAFLQIMRSFEPTQAKEALYRSTLAEAPYPRQVIWGEKDPALTVDHFGELAREAAGVDHLIRLPARHFLQEDQAPAVAAAVAELTRST